MAALFVILVLSKRIPTVIGSNALMGVGGLSLVAGSVLSVAGVLVESGSVLLAGAGLGGVAIAVFKIGWGEICSSMGLLRSLTSISFALIASSVLVLLVSNLPPAFLFAFLIAVGLLCMPLERRGFRDLERHEAQEPARRSTLAFSSTLLILPIIVGMSSGFMKGIFPMLAGNQSESTQVLVLVANGVAGVVLLICSYHLRGMFGPAQVYSIGLIFVVAGLILFASQSVSVTLSLLAYETGFSIFYFFMIVYWGDISKRTGLPIVKVYVLGYFSYRAAQILSSVAVFYVGRSGLLDGTVSLLALSAVLAIFVASLLLFGSNQSPVRQWLVTPEPSVESNDAIPDACDSIAKSAGLSPREREVLVSLSRGRNASYISRTLYISPDTAKSHIKSIYRKVGVHTQQELLDRIEERVEVQASIPARQGRFVRRAFP